MGLKTRPAQRLPLLALLLSCVVLAVPQAAGAQRTGGTQGAEGGTAGKPSRVAGATKAGLTAKAHKREREQKKRAREKREREAKEKEEAAAEDDGEEDIWEGLFPWADDGGLDDNWLSGLGLAILGMIGALVTLYAFLGGFLPSMGGKAEYEKLGEEIETLSQRRDAQLKPRESFVRGSSSLSEEEREEATRLTEDFNRIIEQKEAAARKLHRSLLAVGFPVYVVLGAAFAVLLASTALQAIAIGFGWTAVADRLGLKREEEEKKRTRAEETETIVNAAKETEKTKAKLAAVEKQAGEMLSTATKAIARANKKAEKASARAAQAEGLARKLKAERRTAGEK